MRPKSAVVLYASIKHMKNEVFETIATHNSFLLFIFCSKMFTKKVRMFIYLP